MESIAYYDGKIGAPEELMVPFNDRVHFFGDGCYDATVGANGKVYLLQDHLDRFFTSAKALDINIPMSIVFSSISLRYSINKIFVA